MVVAVTTSAAFLGDPAVAELEPEPGDAIREVVGEGDRVGILRFTDTDEPRSHPALAAFERARGIVDRRREGHVGRIAPQPFESVELTFFIQKNVDHEIDVIE